MSRELPSVLDEIIAKKQLEVESRSTKTPISLLENIIIEQNDEPRGFYRAMQQQCDKGQPAIIAEIKKASPSKGILCEHFDPVEIAKAYEAGGATCLSVLTDETFYQGCDSHLDLARENTQLPVLRKDFVIDAYQVFEARTIGADCILLIARCLSRDQLYTLTRLAYDLGMDVLMEVHDIADVDKVAGLPIRMIAINNCDLGTFEVDLATAFDLSLLIPDDILIVAESGISAPEEIRLLQSSNIKGFLVGDSLANHPNPSEKLQQLIGEQHVEEDFM